MSTNTKPETFKEALAALRKVQEDFSVGKVSPVDYGRLRGVAISAALLSMAKDFDVRLEEPLQLNSNGEYAINALEEGESTTRHVGCGPYGEKYASWLNKYKPRTGVAPGATLPPESGWCWLNHFSAERMVFDYAAHLAV